MSYVKANGIQVKAEYQQVLQTSSEICQCWEKHNCVSEARRRHRFTQITTIPRKPEQKAFRAKFAKQKTRRTAEQQ